MSLNGLVLGGGKSTRMGFDKGQIVYHKQPQITHCFSLLAKFCCSTFISCRQEQSTNFAHHATIIDLYNDIGPAGGLLSAYAQDPLSGWLVLACDLPFVNEECLQLICNKRNKKKAATLYIHANKKIEPLCAIWEPQSLSVLYKNMLDKNFSLTKVLQQLPCEKIIADNHKVFTNVNDYDTYKHLKSKE